MSILFLIHSEYILVARRSHSNGDVVRHLGFLNRFFCLLTVYKKVYGVIDHIHVIGFIQSVSNILVRGEINVWCMNLHGIMKVDWKTNYHIFRYFRVWEFLAIVTKRSCVIFSLCSLVKWLFMETLFFLFFPECICSDFEEVLNSAKSEDRKISRHTISVIWSSKQYFKI